MRRAVASLGLALFGAAGLAGLWPEPEAAPPPPARDDVPAPRLTRVSPAPAEAVAPPSEPLAMDAELALVGLSPEEALEDPEALFERQAEAAEELAVEHLLEIHGDPALVEELLARHDALIGTPR